MAKCVKLLIGCLLAMAQIGSATTNNDGYEQCHKLILGDGLNVKPLITVTRKLLPGSIKWENYPTTPHELLVLHRMALADVEQNWQDILASSPKAKSVIQKGDRVRGRLIISKQDKSSGIGPHAEFELRGSFEVRGWREGQFVSSVIVPEDLSVMNWARLTERYLRALNSITLSIALSQGEQKEDVGLFEHFFEAIERAVARPRMPWLPIGREIELIFEQGQESWSLIHFHANSPEGKDPVTLDISGIRSLLNLIQDQATIAEIINPEGYEVEKEAEIILRFLGNLKDREKDLSDQLVSELGRGDYFDFGGDVISPPADWGKRQRASKNAATLVGQRLSLVRREISLLKRLVTPVN